jgi:hypothetical protein
VHVFASVVGNVSLHIIVGREGAGPVTALCARGEERVYGGYY